MDAFLSGVFIYLKQLDKCKNRINQTNNWMNSVLKVIKVNKIYLDLFLCNNFFSKKIAASFPTISASLYIIIYHHFLYK